SLQACSPAINAGRNSYAVVATDMAGNSRIQLGRVDMGAYESVAEEHTAGLPNTGVDVVVSNMQQSNAVTYYSNNCNGLVATITGDGSATSVSGNTTVKLWVEANPAAVDFVVRHYEITPDNNADEATGTVTLYFTQDEFEAYNTAHAGK